MAICTTSMLALTSSQWLVITNRLQEVQMNSNYALFCPKLVRKAVSFVWHHLRQTTRYADQRWIMANKRCHRRTKSIGWTKFTRPAGLACKIRMPWLDFNCVSDQEAFARRYSTIICDLRSLGCKVQAERIFLENMNMIWAKLENTVPRHGSMCNWITKKTQSAPKTSLRRTEPFHLIERENRS